MRYTDRFEYKYVLDLRTYLALKNKLKTFMDVDYHTRILPNKRYFVRSLYYDTYHYSHCRESEEGQYGRVKCRIRTYHHAIDKVDVISIEIKTKQGLSVIKYSELISKKEFLYFLEHKRFNKRTLVLDEFTRLVYEGHLEPKVIVEYEREGYIAKDGSAFRLTFDHDVRSANAQALFGDFTSVRPHHHAIVCEIKCGMERPAWLEQLVKDYGLKVIRNSKYVQAVQLFQPSLIY